MKQGEIAKAIEVSQGHISDILTGKRPVGKRTAARMSRLTGRPWHLYLVMPPDKIREDLVAAIEATAPEV